MPPMFLNPEVIYRVQLYNSTWSLIEDVDPYVPRCRSRQRSAGA